MNDERRQELIRRLQHGEELSPEWARILFPPEKREYELVYHGKEREEDTLLWYSKRSGTRFKPLWIEKHNQGNLEGHWHHFWSTADRKTMRYKLLGVTPEIGQWTWKKKRALAALANYKRYLKEGGGRMLAEYWRDTGSVFDFVRASPDDGKPQYWRAPAEHRLADTAWSGVPVYANDNG